MSASISLLLIGETADSIRSRLAGFAGQDPGLEVVIVDRTEGFVAAGVAEEFAQAFPVTVLRQGPASLAMAGNLAVFGASAPILLLLDPEATPESGLAAAHVAAHRRASEANAVIGTVSAGSSNALGHALLGDRPRLFSFGWRESTPRIPARGEAWGGSVSVRRDFLIRHGLFDPLGRPGFEDVEWAWRLCERPLAPVFAPEARMRLTGSESVDDYLARAFRHGLQEDLQRHGRRRSLADRIGRPADWLNRRKMRTVGATALFAAARQAEAERPGSPMAVRALLTALFAAWREGRSDAIRRQTDAARSSLSPGD
ncbi:hypothetical protein C3941_22020 [Kaistia algarum]|uniref:hypothetical protein n=1 Tax=Kaistia algarum TaxID=2083279 RepID=UPI000CE7529E|nr:hypothetical protein [Kaistia algarum]MCX5516594.1 hypothetical protein [Kaistia algarum]PPE77730.1 hypothetical protein C3941_22020 [Kaistia algarum]